MAPRFKNSTISDAVTICCRLGQYSDARVREEGSRGEVGTSHEVFHAKQSTTQFILANDHTLQIGASDYVLQFDFKIAHLAGSVNTAADFLSRIEPKVTEKLCLKIREAIQTTPIEVTASSSDVADEEKFSFPQADNKAESENKPLNGKNNRVKMRSIGQQTTNHSP